jgi:hypothetical protein
MGTKRWQVQTRESCSGRGQERLRDPCLLIGTGKGLAPWRGAGEGSAPCSPMPVAAFIAQSLADQGIDTILTVTGGASRRLEDGTMVSSPLEDMFPFLSREELAENMIAAKAETA